MAAACATATPLGAQVPDSARRPTQLDSAVAPTAARRAQGERRVGTHHIRWYEVAAVASGVAAVSALDEPIQRFMQRHRSKTTDDVSSVFRIEGEPLFYAGVSIGTFAIGTLIDNDNMQRAGARMVAAVAISAGAAEGMKRVIGRSRPNEGVGAYSFHPFTSFKDSAGTEARRAMPSGHVTAAFAIATSLADDVRHRPVVDVLLYAFATGTAYSRINDDRHWFSDTVMGAAVGITSAKLVNGHWRIFHLRPPGFLLTPEGDPGVSWNVPFGRARSHEPDAGRT